MNREQKAAAVAEIAESIKEADAVFAIDYRGISVPQAAELRTRLRDVDASFRVVKNSLTERAVDEVGADALKALLEGPTALTFVRGDAALAAKALQTFRRETDRLEFKGGLLGAEAARRRADPGARAPARPRRALRPARRRRGLAHLGPGPHAERADRRPRPAAGPDRREEGERRDPGGRAARGCDRAGREAEAPAEAELRCRGGGSAAEAEAPAEATLRAEARLPREADVPPPSPGGGPAREARGRGARPRPRPRRLRHDRGGRPAGRTTTERPRRIRSNHGHHHC